MNFHIGDRVVSKVTDKPGKVVGATFYSFEELLRPTILVELDEGFFSEDRSQWVSMVCIHPDNLEMEKID